MASALPAIPNGSRKMSQSPTIREYKSTSAYSQGSSRHTKVSGQGKKERDLIARQLYLRAQQKELNKRDTSKYRNTYKHNLCLDMLQEGFHKSFAELFALIKQQNETREQAGPESVLWNQTMLENEPEKLDTLRLYLTQAENALRKENYKDVYLAQYHLAKYFQETGDKWLSDHFYSECLATSAFVVGDEGRVKAEGHCFVGLALEESGNNFEAMENFEAFHKLTVGKKDEWTTSQGENLYFLACTHLMRIYTAISYHLEMNNNSQQSLEYLLKACNIAKEGEEKNLEGEACYRLGLAYEKAHNSETALKYLNDYLNICQSLGDSIGIGRACEAIAKSYESENKVEESIKYLEMYLDVAERSKDDKCVSKAASDLGGIFNSLGRYQQAVDYFNKSYNISRTLNDTEAISSSRVLFGVAAAHKMLENVTDHVDQSSRPCIERLVEWKDNRGDEFNKPIPVKEKEDTKSKEVEKETPKVEQAEEKAEEVPPEPEEKKEEVESKED